MDKRARAMLQAAIEAGGEGRHYFDLEAAAVYRIEPPGHEAVAVLCPPCQLVTIKIGAPRRELVTVQCQGCGRGLELRPPAEVVAYGRSGIRSVIDLARPH